MVIKLGHKVSLKNNPNPVKVIYKVEELNNTYRDGQLKQWAVIRPVENVSLPDGGFISTQNTREEKLSDLVIEGF